MRGTGTAPFVTTYRRHRYLQQILVHELNPTGPWHHDSRTENADERIYCACAAETTNHFVE